MPATAPGVAAASSGFVAMFEAAGPGKGQATVPGTPTSVAVDATGIYVTGYTAAAGLRGADVFVQKLSAGDMRVIYSVTLSGSADDIARGIAVDSSGQVYVTGSTLSADFPTTAGALQQKAGALGDAFVAKLDRDGKVVWATYLGGESPDIAYGIAVDFLQNAYVTGATASRVNFPVTAGAFQAKFAGPAPSQDDPDADGDAFLAKFSAPGSLVWSTYIGGSRRDAAAGIALDETGNVFLAITSESDDFPRTAGALPDCRRGIGRPVVAQFNPEGGLVHATSIAGSGLDAANAIAYSSLQGVYLAGDATSRAFLATPGAARESHSGGESDGFVAFLDLTAQPKPATACVLNAASFLAGNYSTYADGAVAPGEIVSIFGANFGAAARVLFDGVPAPLLYRAEDQINAVVPYGVVGAATGMTLESDGGANGPWRLPVNGAVPAIFTLDGSGAGQAAVLNQDGSLNSVGNPAGRGDIITFYAAGAGSMNPPVADGTIASLTVPPEQQPRPQLPIEVLIRGVSARVLYAGAAPGFVSGLLQVNVEVPRSIDFGNHVPLSLRVGDFTSQYQVTIGVK